MSTDGCLTLADYIGGLLDALRDEDATAYGRLLAIVGPRRARLELGDEVVTVGFADGRLDVREDGASPVDGTGSTDRQTVLELLDGYLEVGAAIAEGRLRARGHVDAVARMFAAIELLIDAAARGPALQALADTFRADPCRPPRRPPEPPPPPGGDAERELLARYDLQPD
jgi:hypothetical protein